MNGADSRSGGDCASVSLRANVPAENRFHSSVYERKLLTVYYGNVA